MAKTAVKKGQKPTAEKLYRQICTLVNAYNSMSRTEEEKLVLQTVYQQMETDTSIRHHSRVWMSDMMTVALGRMGFRESRFRKLNDTLSEVVKDYCDKFKEDFRDDTDMVYSRELLERELRSYTGSFYTPENERYR